MTPMEFKPIPVQKGWPLLGILPKLLSQDPYEYLKNVMLEQGDFVQLNFGSQHVYLVSHPDYLQRILRDNYQNYRKPAVFYNTARGIAGNGLGTSSGDFWLRQRRMIQPHLHRKQLEYIFSDMRDAILEVLNSWELLAKDNVQIELRERMAEITMNAITYTMFGKETLPVTDVVATGRRATRVIKYIGGTIFSSFLPKWFPTAGKQQFIEDRNSLKQTIHQVIDKCRQNKEMSAGLIQMLINAVDEDSHQQMSEEQVFDEVMTIFLAGYETAATALSWLGVIIQSHPDVLKKLHEEIDQVLGSRIPSFEDIPRLVYTRKVFMEVLRMHTIVPFLPRSLNEPDRLGEYSLPADALVLLFYHGVHHNPKVWTNPETFDPERFRPEEIATQHPFAYVPFSAGPRKCAGEEFALLEGPLIMAMLLQKYDIRVLPNQNFTAGIGSTMYPRYGVKAKLETRKTDSI